jgi:divalent metal cation (Fe/Co/Zn/Cd) transporter
VVLLAISWRSRTVLGGLLGAAGIPIVGFALVSGPHGDSVAALVIALVLLVVGSALYRLGQTFERLLDADPEDEA